MLANDENLSAGLENLPTTLNGQIRKLLRVLSKELCIFVFLGMIARFFLRFFEPVAHWEKAYLTFHLRTEYHSGF